MHSPEIEKLIETLQTKVRHLENDIALTTAESEKTAAAYLEILREQTGTNKQLQQEIAERRKAESELQESETKYKTLVQTISDIIYKIDRNGEFTFLNNAVTQLGYQPEELIGRHFSSLIHPDDLKKASREHVLNEEDEAGQNRLFDESPLKFFDERRTGRRITRNLELRLLNRDREVRETSISHVPVEVFSSGEYTQEGMHIGSIGVIRDITERKKAEQALRESEERFRELAEMLPGIVFETDGTGRLTFVNRRCHEITACTQDNFENGFRAADLFVPEDRDKVEHHFRRLLDGEEVSLAEYAVLRPGGSSFPALVQVAPILRRGASAGLRGIVFDLTERKRLEEEQNKASKLESVGILAGGIAHDFNNILTAVLGNITLARLSLSGQEDLQSLLCDAEKASLRAKDLTQQLLTFSRGGAPVKKATSIASLIRESAGFALRGSNVKSEFIIAGDLWPVEVDAGQLNQVVNNLVINADQAMPEGGTITIRASNVTLGPRDALPLQDGRYVRISVEDQGVGIARDQLSKIFDPYFTTKQRGSGLGLATTYSIIKKHEGHITVESGLGVGTTFHVFLPACDSPVPEKEEKVSGEPVRKMKVLVMDDEEMVRKVVSMMLRHFGHTVEVAADGTEALGIYRQALEEKKPFDAVIMDLTIPGGMGGKEAVKKLLEIDPRARAIVSSGYSFDPVLANYREYGFRGLVSKPFRAEELNEVLGRLEEQEA
jgi:two-component system, cell cycle sensor histidine kinase and response regulator CckA